MIYILSIVLKISAFHGCNISNFTSAHIANIVHTLHREMADIFNIFHQISLVYAEKKVNFIFCTGLTRNADRCHFKISFPGHFKISFLGNLA